jgi:lipoyl synthase
MPTLELPPDAIRRWALWQAPVLRLSPGTKPFIIKGMTQRLPEWLTIRLPRPDTIKEVEGMMRAKNLHTVCESARCPNLPECWSKKTATFMILGDTCTRSCGFCAIKVGRGLAIDPEEAGNVATVTKDLGLKHVVVTSVARDDLADEGSMQFAETIRALHSSNPLTIVEVLTPDFKAKRWCIKNVTDARPEIYNHNIETIERLHTVVRPQARYSRSLEVLRTVKALDSSIYTKSGIMLGLGETRPEVVRTLEDLRSAGVDAVTIGQYLRPTMRHLPVNAFVHPDEFREYEKIGTEMGFAFVASGPFIRSSYNAIEFSKKVMAERVARMDAEDSTANRQPPTASLGE